MTTTGLSRMLKTTGRPHTIRRGDLIAVVTAIGRTQKVEELIGSAQQYDRVYTVLASTYTNTALYPPKRGVDRIVTPSGDFVVEEWAESPLDAPLFVRLMVRGGKR